MKETGIIMSGNHPKLILDGIKTQTRRVVKPELKRLIHNFDNAFSHPSESYKIHVPVRHPEEPDFSDHRITRIYCPYGQVGDRLWVRETWAAKTIYDHLKPSEIPETAKIYFVNKDTRKAGGYSLFTEIGKTRSAMFMCEWMSSVTLEITEVRVERIQEITEEDAVAEGVIAEGKLTAYGEFMRLWDSLNAKRGYSWSNNPWVWCLSFRRLE